MSPNVTKAQNLAVLGNHLSGNSVTVLTTNGIIEFYIGNNKTFI